LPQFRIVARLPLTMMSLRAWPIEIARVRCYADGMSASIAFQSAPVPPTAFARACFLTGPTAVGKTAVGIELARRIGAEIVSMDSMALYQGMDIGTAKPNPAERHAVAHHLVDVLAPHEDFSLAQYLDAAAEAAADIRARGREVLFVGGTPLYLKGLLRGIFEGPPADWQFRRALQQEMLGHDADWLHQRLAVVDPAAAARLHPNDTRRLVRALEVFEKTGRPISALQQQFETGRPAHECRVFVLDRPRTELHSRIDARVDTMFAQGLVDEVRGLLALQKGTVPFSLNENWDSPRPLSKTARQAVGYCEVIEHLAGDRGLAETIELVKTHTRQLAKRQATWFRSLSECRFVPFSGTVEAGEIAGRILELPHPLGL
jgi:tRNA dimethylallyltransferase